MKQEINFIPWHLQCNYQDNPLGVTKEAPMFSWQIIFDKKIGLQNGFELEVSADNFKNDCQCSGFIVQSESAWRFHSLKLKSKTLYKWRVRVKISGLWSTWSREASFATALFSLDDWCGANWIALSDDSSTERIVPGIHYCDNPENKVADHPLPIFRKQFNAHGKVKQALGYICGLGHFELLLNGRKVGNHFLDPGWTQYDKIKQYLTFDLTEYLNDSSNVIGVRLGNGFWAVPNQRYFKWTGCYGIPRLIFYMQIEYHDGTNERIVSDDSWQTTAGPITFSSIYGGEDYDAGREPQGWLLNDFDATNWHPAMKLDAPYNTLRPQTAPSLKVKKMLPAMQTFYLPNGNKVYDFGQNFSGIFSVDIQGESGDKIHFYPTETDPRHLTCGDAWIMPGIGRCSFTYTLRGGEREQWQPAFTYTGFRYLEVECLPAIPGTMPHINKICGLHTMTDARNLSTFSCSDELLNRIYKLIDWSVRSNLSSILTDCPHREKLGWAECAYLTYDFIPRSYSLGAFYQKILDDMVSEQREDGLVPNFAPAYVQTVPCFWDSPEWGSAMILLPEMLYDTYADSAVLERYYPAMKRYAEYLAAKCNHNLLEYGLGDWCDIGPAEPGYSQLTTPGFTSSVTFFRDLSTMARVADILGKNEDAASWKQQSLHVKTAINECYLHNEGYYDKNSQCANAMALACKIVPTEMQHKVLNHLLDDIRQRKYALTAGDIGYRYLIQILSESGHSNILQEVYTNCDIPGYGYQLAQGATALTESWQAFVKCSHNHCMLGHLQTWILECVGGIKRDLETPGWQKIIIKPDMVSGIMECNSSFESPYGLIQCNWKRQEAKIELHIGIPGNTTARLQLPLNNNERLFCNGENVKTDGPMSDVLLSSGNYVIEMYKEFEKNEI